MFRDAMSTEFTYQFAILKPEKAHDITLSQLKKKLLFSMSMYLDKRGIPEPTLLYETYLNWLNGKMGRKDFEAEREREQI